MSERSQHQQQEPLAEQTNQLAIDLEAHNLMANTEEREASYSQFDGMLESQALLVPEVTEKHDDIEAAGKRLIDNFDIQSEFFESKDRSLIFTAISAKLANMDDLDLRGHEFIADATFLLARDFIPGFDDLKTEIDDEDNPNVLSDDGQQAIYDKYTDKEFTARMKKAIDEEGLLDGAKSRLGIGKDNEDEYDVRVLSISDNNFMVGDFKRPQITDWEDMQDLPHDEQKRIIREDSEQVELYRTWSSNLVKRRTDFLDELGDTQHNAMAWMIAINGKKQLCISSVMAERLLDRDSVTTQSYADQDFERELAILEHEYTHTQGGLLVDGKIDFGISLEEVRAEEYSGGRQGYLDAKNFCNDITLMTGKNPRSLISEAKLKGGSQEEVFTALANDHGLARMLEIVAVMPSNYQEEQSNILRRSIQTHLGGYDGVIRNLYADQQELGDEALQGVHIRADKTAKALQDIIGNSDVWDWEGFMAYRKKSTGLVFSTDIITEAGRQKGYSEEVDADQAA